MVNGALPHFPISMLFKVKWNCALFQFEKGICLGEMVSFGNSRGGKAVDFRLQNLDAGIDFLDRERAQVTSEHYFAFAAWNFVIDHVATFPILPDGGARIGRKTSFRKVSV